MERRLLRRWERVLHAMGVLPGLLVLGAVRPRTSRGSEVPFKSQAQRRFMHAQHPRIADKWEREGGTPKKIPKRVKAPKKGGK